jgi:hypothetical protein
MWDLRTTEQLRLASSLLDGVVNFLLTKGYLSVR